MIDHHNGIPAYRQIMDQVRLQISGGMLAPGAELPSTRTLAAALSLNPMTVSKAYSLLERDGILERRRGQALVVRAVHEDDSQTDRIEQLRRSLSGPAAIAHQLGIPPVQATRIFREALDAFSNAPTPR